MDCITQSDHFMTRCARIGRDGISVSLYFVPLFSSVYLWAWVWGSTKDPAGMFITLCLYGLAYFQLQTVFHGAGQSPIGVFKTTFSLITLIPLHYIKVLFWLISNIGKTYPRNDCFACHKVAFSVMLMKTLSVKVTPHSCLPSPCHSFTPSKSPLRGTFTYLVLFTA